MTYKIHFEIVVSALITRLRTFGVGCGETGVREMLQALCYILHGPRKHNSRAIQNFILNRRCKDTSASNINHM